MKMDLRSWMQIVLSITLGATGALLFKLGIDQAGGLEGKPLFFWIKFLFTPNVFIGLALLFSSRLLWSLPLSKIGLGKYVMIVTPLNLLVIAILSHIIFKEILMVKDYIGILLALISVFLLAR